jgi:glutamine amidotransferase
MCRHLAYLGGPSRLADLVLTPPHSLVEQSHAARELLRGSVCADGFGVGWYADGDPEPAVYRRECPIWSDPDLAAVARVVSSGCVVASVRNATPEVGHVGASGVQPLASGRFLFAHNGFVADFAERAREFRALLPDDLYAAHRGGGDSETLFLLTLARIREADGDLAAGTAAALADVAQRAPGSALNVVVTDGRALVASRFRADDDPADSLYLLQRPGAVLVASEPLDGDPGWTAVPEGNLAVLGAPADSPRLTEVVR